MRTPRIVAGWLIGALAVVATGCPEIVITDIGLVPESVGEGRFTLAARTEATYERDECQPGPDGGREPGEPAPDDCEPMPETMPGHGLLGVWLPEGWRVDAARLVDAQGKLLERLTAHPAAEPVFPEVFQTYAGKWWSLVTGCQDLREGTVEFLFEFDVTGPADQQLVRTAVSAALYDETWFEEDHEFAIDESPQFGVVDLAAATLSRHQPTKRGKRLEFDRCAEPGFGQVDPGPRGCSCAGVGAPSARHYNPMWLLSLVTGAVEL